MSSAMKGLLKGLRYISEIFEADNEKEPEIQIGAPTDVKHVAHIGCDGPSSSAPSWMNEFQGSSDSQTGTNDALSSGIESSGSPTRRGKSKQSRRQAAGSLTSSPDRESKPRKNKNANNDETSRSRKTKNSTTGSESPSQDPGVKKNRKKKGQSIEGGAAKPSRTKNHDSSTMDDEPKANEVCL